MAAFLGIEATKHCDSTPTERQVPRVHVSKQMVRGPKLNVQAAKMLLAKFRTRAVVVQKKLLQVHCIVLEQGWGPCSEKRLLNGQGQIALKLQWEDDVAYPMQSRQAYECNVIYEGHENTCCGGLHCADFGETSPELATFALTGDELTVCPPPKDILDESMGYLPHRCVPLFHFTTGCIKQVGGGLMDLIPAQDHPVALPELQ